MGFPGLDFQMLSSLATWAYAASVGTKPAPRPGGAGTSSEDVHPVESDPLSVHPQSTSDFRETVLPRSGILSC
jgi:hypothetical protein